MVLRKPFSVACPVNIPSSYPACCLSSGVVGVFYVLVVFQSTLPSCAICFSSPPYFWSMLHQGDNTCSDCTIDVTLSAHVSEIHSASSFSRRTCGLCDIHPGDYRQYSQSLSGKKRGVHPCVYYIGAIPHGIVSVEGGRVDL